MEPLRGQLWPRFLAPAHHGPLSGSHRGSACCGGALDSVLRRLCGGLFAGLVSGSTVDTRSASPAGCFWMASPYFLCDDFLGS